MKEIYHNSFSDSCYLRIASVEELKKSKLRVKIVPNPINDNSILEIVNGSYKCKDIRIYNYQGQIIKNEFIIGNTFSLSKHNFPKGLYFLRIKDDNNEFIEKFVVE